ncbi:hypothetical protein ACEPAH_9223 [Sanghuangporus vaninii]
MENNFTARANTTLRITADSVFVQGRCWLLTEPIDDYVLQQKRGSPIYLTTVSRHQGWVYLPGQGSWSWFELAIIPSNTQVRIAIVVIYREWVH